MKQPENIQEIVRYIFQFLLRTEDEEILKFIAYTSDTKEFEKYKLVIKPSRFFDADFYGTPASLPALPLQILKSPSGGVATVLFGEPNVEKTGNTLVLHADFIASAYFLISRYEEMICPNIRDKHGRFIGKESIAYKAGFLHRPVVEEYGRILREYVRQAGLEINEPEENIARIFLTHDVDKIAHYRNPKSVLGAVLRFYKAPKNAVNAIKTYFGTVNTDPWFTFPWLIALKNKLQKALPTHDVQSIYFIKCGGGKHQEDKPLQNIESRDYKYLFDFIKRNNGTVGLHPSYRAGIQPEFIKEEKTLLEKALGDRVSLSRNHYLCSREPDDFQSLIRFGFTDDFTMGYADAAGFRLGTCRPVRWIDPKKQQLTAFVLHPLTIMDNTLSDKKYMGLDEDAAFEFVLDMIGKVKKENGELVLLWHNQSVEVDNGQYHRQLYERIIEYLKKTEQ